MVKRALHVNIPIVKVVHICPPIVVHTDLASFRKTVQELTGFKRISDKPDDDQFIKDTTNYPFMIKTDGTFCDEQINACHLENHDHINAPYETCENDCIDDQTDGSIDVDYDGLIMETSSSSNDSLISQQQHEDTSSLMIWDYDEHYRVFACSVNACTYAPESQHAGIDLQPDNEFMDIFCLEKTLGFIDLEDEHSNHHDNHLSMEVLSLISA